MRARALWLVLLLLFGVSVLGCSSSTTTRTDEGDHGGGPGIEERAQMDPDECYRVKVQPFENSVDRNKETSDGLTSMFVSTLNELPYFMLYDDESYRESKGEMEMGSTDDFDASTVAETGKFEGAEWWVKGKLVEVVKDKDGVGMKSLLGSAKSVTALIRVHFKIVQIRTGRILWAKDVVGEATSVSWGVGVPLVIGVKGWEESPLGEAAKECMKEAARQIRQQLRKRSPAK